MKKMGLFQKRLYRTKAWHDVIVVDELPSSSQISLPAFPRFPFSFPWGYLWAEQEFLIPNLFGGAPPFFWSQTAHAYFLFKSLTLISKRIFILHWKHPLCSEPTYGLMDMCISSWNGCSILNKSHVCSIQDLERLLYLTHKDQVSKCTPLTSLEFAFTAYSTYWSFIRVIL